MNRLEVIEAKSEHVREPHRVLTLDGVPLDVLLDAGRPGLGLLGLIPALLDWLSDPTERELVWQRIMPPVGRREVAPVLICPDDLDLWCTVVVAEVAPEESAIWWHRIGLDVTRPKPEDMPNAVGTTVDWIDGFGAYRFGRAEYERCLAAFQPAGLDTNAAAI